MWNQSSSLNAFHSFPLFHNLYVCWCVRKGGGGHYTNLLIWHTMKTYLSWTRLRYNKFFNNYSTTCFHIKRRKRIWLFVCISYSLVNCYLYKIRCSIQKRIGAYNCCVPTYKLSFLLYCQHINYCDLLLMQMYWIASCDFYIV